MKWLSFFMGGSMAVIGVVAAYLSEPSLINILITVVGFGVLIASWLDQGVGRP